MKDRKILLQVTKQHRLSNEYINVSHTINKSGKRKFNQYFFSYLKDNSGFLQQVSSHVRSYNLISLIKTNFRVFPKPTAVVIAGGLGISNSLQNIATTKKITTIKNLCIHILGAVIVKSNPVC